MGLFSRNPQKKKNFEMVKKIRSLVKEKRYVPALKTAIAYLKEVPDNPDILFIAGSIYYMQRRYAMAIIYLERAIEITRYDPEVLAIKAQCHHRLGQKSMAEECWKDILEVDPNNAEALSMLGYEDR